MESYSRHDYSSIRKHYTASSILSSIIYNDILFLQNIFRKIIKNKIRKVSRVFLITLPRAFHVWAFWVQGLTRWLARHFIKTLFK